MHDYCLTSIITLYIFNHRTRNILKNFELSFNFLNTQDSGSMSGILCVVIKKQLLVFK